MKKRILLLVPCLLLALGLLTACGSNGSGGQSTGELKNKLTQYTWQGSAESTSGNIGIGLPFGLGKLIDIKFDDNGTGYITFLEGGPAMHFYWHITDDEVRLSFNKDEGYLPFKLNFSMNDHSLTLKGTGLLSGININLKHQA